MSFRLTIALALALPAGAVADEARFNPPHRGAFLGVQIENRLDGMRVTQVVAGGAAERAGVEEEDRIVRLGDWNFQPEGQPLPEFLRDIKAGNTTIQVLRDGAELDLAIELDSALAAAARATAQYLEDSPLFQKAEAGDLESLSEDLLEAVRSTNSRERAYEAMNEVIDRFDLSHTALLPPWTAANLFGPGEHYHLGMFVQRLKVDGEARYFIRSMMFGSPSRTSGLRIGDELVSVNGVAFGDSPRRTLAGFEHRRQMYAVQIDRGETVRIAYRRKAGGKVKRVRATADQVLDGVRSARESVRLIGDGDAAKIGYIHFWNVMSGDNVDLLNEAMEGEFKDAAALAIDLRGRGGQVAVINAIAKILSREKRPVALLIDREARSAKEMLAHRLQGWAHITLVGETTAGAVLPARFVGLPGDGQLMLPAPGGDRWIRPFTRGVRLEGRGAIPDIEVPSPLPYRAGKDPILDAGLELLRKQVKGKLVKV